MVIHSVPSARYLSHTSTASRQHGLYCAPSVATHQIIGTSSTPSWNSYEKAPQRLILISSAKTTCSSSKDATPVTETTSFRKPYRMPPALETTFLPFMTPLPHRVAVILSLWRFRLFNSVSYYETFTAPSRGRRVSRLTYCCGKAIAVSVWATR
jgi:hypothetical protein